MRAPAIRHGWSRAVALVLVLAAFATLTLAVAAPVNAAVSTITSVAGEGPPATAKATAIALNPQGVAVSGSTLYVSDELTCSVRAVDLGTGAQHVVVGTGRCPDHPPITEIVPCEPSTCVPGIIAVGPNGNIYGINGERVVRIDSSHVGHAVAGNGQRGFSGDGGPATEATPNNRVSRLDGSGERVTVAGTGEFGFSGDGGPAVQAKLFYPYDLAFGPTGDLFVADGLNKRIRKVTSPSAPAPSPTEQEERFIRRAYADLLARAPSPGELAGATMILAATGSRTQLAIAIVNSYEWRKLLARAIWISLVAREPSAWEIDIATSLLVGGSPVEQVTAFVAGSSEARARAGGTPEGYVDTLFRGAWGVQPDAVGKAAWVEALNAGLPPWHAAFAFLTDHNADRRLVEFAYTAYLRFPADEAGVTFWTAQLDKGLRAEHLLAAFIGSTLYWDAS